MVHAPYAFSPGYSTPNRPPLGCSVATSAGGSMAGVPPAFDVGPIGTGTCGYSTPSRSLLERSIDASSTGSRAFVQVFPTGSYSTLPVATETWSTAAVGGYPAALTTTSGILGSGCITPVQPPPVSIGANSSMISARPNVVEPTKPRCDGEPPQHNGC